MNRNSIIHYPRLDTVIMVENKIKSQEEWTSKRQLWLSLDKKVPGICLYL